MSDPFLLDTSAFIALADKEPGFERVKDMLRAARRGEIELHACFISLTEVRYILTYDRGTEKAARIVEAIRKFPIQWLHSNDALCGSAAEIKSMHKLSLADSFIAAAALRLRTVLVHKDPEFKAITNLKQQVLTSKRASGAQ